MTRKELSEIVSNPLTTVALLSRLHPSHIQRHLFKDVIQDTAFKFANFRDASASI